MKIEKYLGIPYLPGGSSFQGCDCMGLVRLVLAEEEGVVSTEEFGPVVGYPEWLHVDSPKELDVVLLRIMNQPIHCGVVLGGQKMLHTTIGIGSHVVRYDDLRWGSRIVGFARHKELAGRIA